MFFLKLFTLLIVFGITAPYQLHSQGFASPRPMSPDQLKANISKLTKEQYAVTQQDSSEPPYKNAYWNNYTEGIYVDIVSGEPLFNSLDKFDSNTGWPSFIEPISSSNIVLRTDHKLLLPTVEVRSKVANSHLGRLFHDGPTPTGLRYCINSAALRFVPRSRLAQEGYGQFVSLFQKNSIIPNS